MRRMEAGDSIILNSRVFIAVLCAEVVLGIRQTSCSGCYFDDFKKCTLPGYTGFDCVLNQHLIFKPKEDQSVQDNVDNDRKIPPLEEG